MSSKRTASKCRNSRDRRFRLSLDLLYLLTVERDASPATPAVLPVADPLDGRPVGSWEPVE
jgi:hypothetical protein